MTVSQDFQGRPDDLWSLTPSGGCARKVAPSVAREFALLAGNGDAESFMSDVGLAELQGHTIGLTVDFITPIVPDPVDYGRIAAANALSDIYAVGMIPRLALAVACIPDGRAASSFARALAAGVSYLAEHGCALVGGHSVTDPEPKLGFAVVGVPNQTGRSLDRGARPGDALILTKPIGIGVLASACKAGLIGERELQAAIEAMLAPNSFLPALIEKPLGESVHAATDVTGYGLLGHLKEICTRSAVGADITVQSVPVLPDAVELADRGASTSAFGSNLKYVEADFGASLASLPRAAQVVLTDPQTSGGLLLFVSPEAADEVIASLPQALSGASVIGRATAAPGALRLLSS